MTLTGQTFTITKLSTKGAGTATLTCGSGCVLTLDVQIAPERSKFNFLTVAADAGKFEEGIRVRASDDLNVVLPDVKGDWQLTLIGLTDCGVTSGIASFSLDTTGASTTETLTVHTESCGDIITSETFRITTLNPDGSGTALFTCGTSCTWTFTIQLSADRSTFNFTDVTPADTNGYVAGAAIRRSTGGDIVKANSSGAWQGTIIGRTDACDVTSMQVNFTLSAAGTSTNVTKVTHSACAVTQRRPAAPSRFRR